MYFHMLLVHAPIAMALIVAADVHQHGAPPIDHIPGLLTSSGLLGVVVGLFTAHAHVHYLSYIKDIL
jgi:hypothetical protein